MSQPICPTCDRVMPLEDRSPQAALATYAHFPFCCERCKLIDLGNWFDESYKFTRPAEDASELND